MDSRTLIAAAGVFWLSLIVVYAQPPAAKKPAPKKPQIAASRWTGGITGRSKMDDSQTAVYRLPANNVISGWLRKARPVMIARCQESEPDLYIVWGMPAHVESGDSRTLRIRIDNETAETDYWGESTDNNSLFAPDAALFMNRLATARTVRIEFTPFQSVPQVATFDARGFSGPLQTLRKAGCDAAITEAAQRAEAVAKTAAAEAAREARNAAEAAQFGKLVFLSAVDKRKLQLFHSRRSCIGLNGEPTPIMISELSSAEFAPCPTCRPSTEGMKR
jgi:hypothetical protein